MPCVTVLRGACEVAIANGEFAAKGRPDCGRGSLGFAHRKCSPDGMQCCGLRPGRCPGVAAIFPKGFAIGIPWAWWWSGELVRMRPLNSGDARPAVLRIGWRVRLHAAGAPLAHRGFRLHFTARLLSWTGSAVAPLALGDGVVEPRLRARRGAGRRIAGVRCGPGVAAATDGRGVRAAGGFFAPAADGAVAEVVSAGQRHTANALLKFGQNTGKAASPALGGVLDAAAGRRGRSAGTRSPSLRRRSCSRGPGHCPVPRGPGRAWPSTTYARAGTRCAVDGGWVCWCARPR